MGEQRQFFRFRLPWLSAAAAPRPVATPRPAAEPQPQSQAPSQPTVSIPIQRPPFRPAGITPVRTPPIQVQPPPPPPPKTEPQPVPSREKVQTRPQSHTPTPARAAAMASARIAPQPAVPKQESPPRLASQPTGQTSSQPPSPSRRATQVQTLSPPRRSTMATQVASQPPSSTQPTFKPFGVAVKPSEESNQLKDVAPITAAAKEKPKEMEIRKKVGEERRKGTKKGSTHEEPTTVTTKLVAAASEAGTKTRELLGAVLEKGKGHLEKQEDTERKNTLTSSSSDERQIKTASSTYPKGGSRPSNSHETNVDSKSEQVPLHKEIREDISKFVHALVTGKPKLHTDEKSVNIVTLAGENSGASFRCISESTTKDGEGRSKGRKPVGSVIKDDVAQKAYVNSNTQSINNSIMLESRLEGRNPGVHLEFFDDAKELRQKHSSMAGKSKVLVIGGTGYIGKFIVEASVKEGHPTFALVREGSVSDPVKGKVINNFKNLGVHLLYGDLYDHESLVKAIKQADVVISAVGSMQLADQVKFIAAIKEAGNVKRFFPSEFGNDVDRVHAVEPAKTAFATKAQIRRAIEAEGIPYTYVSSNCFAGYFLPDLSQPGATTPPRNKVVIPGDGDPKAVFNHESDIGTYTIKAVDDPRTLNKILYIRPPKNTYSFNEIVALWEKLIGKTLEKTYVPEDQLLKQIKEATFPYSVGLAIRHSVFVRGDHTNFEIEPSFGVEASELYPDVKYTTVEEYLSRLV
ncbi:hypothetical protein E1A91_D02G114500v1 [Gossypium mustelinum]|uniref:NmrA-like domain-containing protein n=1 Tax=Gossypium mustelinum TaxID=34275 RepID=A0A5D2VV25_GOSMU|nr:hypothetical protein E1A91_D02G114500v1 [Gossypium mustelinum]